MEEQMKANIVNNNKFYRFTHSSQSGRRQISANGGINSIKELPVEYQKLYEKKFSYL